VREIEEGRGVELREVDAGRHEPEADQPIGSRVGQGLEQDTVQDAEDRGVRAEGEGERRHRQDREERGPAQPAEDVPQRVGEGHGPCYAAGRARVRKNRRKRSARLTRQRDGTRLRGPWSTSAISASSPTSTTANRRSPTASSSAAGRWKTGSSATRSSTPWTSNASGGSRSRPTPSPCPTPPATGGRTSST